MANSVVAVYFLFLCSSRLAAYRPEPLVSDWLTLPIPETSGVVLKDLRSSADVDRKVFELFGLTRIERALVEDLVNVTLADFKGDESSRGRLVTRGSQVDTASADEPVLRPYCDQLIEVIHATFGPDKGVRATIFQEETGEERLPARLVALYLNWPSDSGVTVESIGSGELLKSLTNVAHGLLGRNGGFRYERMARMYGWTRVDGDVVPTVWLLKPDRTSYWTRSVSLRDGDAITADFLVRQEVAPAEIE